MKCTCGAYKTYGAADNSPLHSDWCDCRNYDALGKALKSAVGKMVAVSHTQQVKYCNWLHWQKPAVKIIKFSTSNPRLVCQDCLDMGHHIGSTIPMQEWDIDDPSAPAVP